VTTGIRHGAQGKGFDIDRKRIELAEPIRNAGTFSVTAKLLGDVTATFKVKRAQDPRSGGPRGAQ
jgi:ribosomal protein L9